jgi:cation diffusion facilitator CzcD-associated flavoprotein CzcO
MKAPGLKVQHPANRTSPTCLLRPDVEIVIVGAGLSGCMGVRLRQAGRVSFLILEKSSELGGTWHDNRYPGCACHIPSQRVTTFRWS